MTPANILDMLMTLDEVVMTLRAKTPGEALGWLKRVGIRPVHLGGRLGRRYMRQDMLEALEAARTGTPPGGPSAPKEKTYRRPPMSKRPIVGRSRKELVEELSGPARRQPLQ